MSIFQKIKEGWKKLSTAEKIGVVIDILCSAGCGTIGVTAGKKLSEGKNVVEKICIRTATAGLGLAAAKVSGAALQESYGNALGDAIDRITGKEKEEAAHE